MNTHRFSEIISHPEYDFLRTNESLGENIILLGLGGSHAYGTNNENSDVDLFVKMPPVFYNAIAAAQFLEELLGCKVDLICDHDNLNPFFRNQIDKYGIDIFRTTGIVAWNQSNIKPLEDAVDFFIKYLDE